MVNKSQFYNIFTGEVEELPFGNQYLLPLQTVEQEDHSSITETAYVPPAKQIQDMMAAGIRLRDERRARFDTEVLKINEAQGEEPPLDPTREPNLDIVDIQRSFARSRANLIAAQEAATQAIKEAKHEAQKAKTDISAPTAPPVKP